MRMDVSVFTVQYSTLHDSTYMLTSSIKASKGLVTSSRELNRELFGKRQGCSGYGKRKEMDERKEEEQQMNISMNMNMIEHKSDFTHVKDRQECVYERGK